MTTRKTITNLLAAALFTGALAPAALAADAPGVLLGGPDQEVRVDRDAVLLKDLDGLMEESKKCRRRDVHWRLDRHEVGPRSVSPGDEITQKIQYVLCGKETRAIDGMLVSKVYFDGAIVSTETRDFRLTPGRWLIDFRVDVPSAAPSGKYVMEIEFVTPEDIAFRDRAGFKVEGVSG